MSNVNVKTITVKMVTATYDLAVAHFANHLESLPGDTSPDAHAAVVLGQVLTDLNYQRAASIPQMLKSHDAKVKRGGAQRATADTVCDTTALLFRACTGVDLERTTAVATPTTDGGADEEVQEPAKAPEAASQPVAARAGAASYTLADGAANLVDPIIKLVSGGRVTATGDLLAALELAESSAANARVVIAAHEAAIAAFQAGDEDVETAGLVDLPKFSPSGLADLPTEHDMLAVLDSQLAAHLAPAATYGDLIGGIAAAEQEIAAAQVSLRGLKRDLRRAQPKKSAPVGMPASSAGQAAQLADTLSEIDEINADCTVVEELATDLFPRCYGKFMDIMKFDVPRLDFGQDHPEVPKLDETFRFHTRVLVEALHSIASDEIIWLHGESGCGKSDFWSQVAAHLNMPFTRINLDGHLVRGDIVGAMKVVADGKGGSETVFVEGALTRALARPGLILLDEFDCGDPEIMPIFQPVLEGKPIVLLEDGGRIVRRHPMCRIAITGNSRGLGSANQMYLNVYEQSAATRDRISAFVEMNYMPPEIEKEVVVARFPDADEAFVEKLIQLANKVRDGYRANEVFSLFSTRAVLSCAKRYVRFAPLYPTPEDAISDILETVIMNRLDEASTNAVRGFIDNIFPS